MNTSKCNCGVCAICSIEKGARTDGSTPVSKQKANCCYKNEDCPICPKVASTPQKEEHFANCDLVVCDGDCTCGVSETKQNWEKEFDKMNDFSVVGTDRFHCSKCKDIVKSFIRQQILLERKKINKDQQASYDSKMEEIIENLTYYHNDSGVQEIDWGVDYVKVEDLKTIINQHKQ